jgi:spore coat polysaccharide biosynthesis predicted glycosyltransferase SpsG
MTVVFAFDEGPGAGLGHRSRCTVIARSLAARGVETALVPIPPAKGSAAAFDAPALVVDSYRCRADDRSQFHGGFVAALDDLARDLDVALVIDPAPGAERAPHRKAGQVLAGGAYTIVDPALRSLDHRPSAVDVHTVLVATGAADHEGVGARIAAAIADTYPALLVRLVVGPWGSRTVPHGVMAVERPDGLATELASADIVVTAGGVAMLEAACLGRPIVALALAPNQRGNVEGIVQGGAALLGDAAQPRSVADAVGRLVGDAALRRELTEAGPRIIDGRGPDRVAGAIAELLVRVAA